MDYSNKFGILQVNKCLHHWGEEEEGMCIKEIKSTSKRGLKFIEDDRW